MLKFSRQLALDLKNNRCSFVRKISEGYDLQGSYFSAFDLSRKLHIDKSFVSAIETVQSTFSSKSTDLVGFNGLNKTHVSRDSFDSLAHSAKSLAEILKSGSNATGSFAFHSAVSSVRENLNLIQQTIDPFPMFQSSIKRAFQTINLEFLQSIKSSRICKKKLLLGLEQEDLWEIPFINNLPIPIFYEITVKGKELGYMHVFDELFSSEEYINDLFKCWESAPILSGDTSRTEAIRQGLQSHTSKRYAVSIRSFLIDMEGMLNKALNVDRSQKWHRDEFKKHFELEKYSQSKRNEIEKVTTIVHKEIFKKNTGKVKRNPILHGNDVDYFNTPYASTYCIMLLDYLIGICSKTIEDHYPD